MTANPNTLIHELSSASGSVKMCFPNHLELVPFEVKENSMIVESFSRACFMLPFRCRLSVVNVNLRVIAQRIMVSGGM